MGSEGVIAHRRGSRAATAGRAGRTSPGRSERRSVSVSTIQRLPLSLRTTLPLRPVRRMMTSMPSLISKDSAGARDSLSSAILFSSCSMRCWMPSTSLPEFRSPPAACSPEALSQSFRAWDKEIAQLLQAVPPELQLLLPQGQLLQVRGPPLLPQLVLARLLLLFRHGELLVALGKDGQRAGRCPCARRRGRRRASVSTFSGIPLLRAISRAWLSPGTPMRMRKVGAKRLRSNPMDAFCAPCRVAP